MAHQLQDFGESRLSGNVVIGELIRNADLGRFEMAYTVLLPCVFTIYLNPESYAALSGVFDLICEDAKRALRSHVAQLNSGASFLGLRRGKKPKEHKIAGRDWDIEFLPDPEVPIGDVEIHSELNETVQPGFRGTKTTLIDREPSATAQRSTRRTEVRNTPDRSYAEIRYEDESGAQVYAVTRNEVRVGRGGNDQPADLALYTTDEVSREHLTIRRDPATGAFSIVDSSTNGTWVNGKRLRKGMAETLPDRAQINLGEAVMLAFESNR